jgi:pyruvate dehydrogenase E2 component (dihydrolipoamide acetyltransferase)
MPSLGADMERGKLVEWLVKPGDYVHRGDLVAAVDTDKAVIDVESFEEGVIAELLVEVGSTVPVGGALARITQTPAAGAEPAGPRPAAAPPAPPRPEPTREPPVQPPGFVSPPVRQVAHRLGVDTSGLRGTGKNGAVTRADVERAAAERPPERKPALPVTGRVRSSPRARQVAAELGVDLGTVSGTGAQGAVTEADVRRAVVAAPSPRTPEPHAAPHAAPPQVEAQQPAAAAKAAAPRAPAPAEAAERAASLRRAIGSLMSRSKKSIPHYYLSTTLDLRAALAWMESANAERPIASRLVPAALLLKASALAARDVPEVNGFFTDGTFRPSTAVHLGVAVALRQGGLVAPAIHDADTLPVDVLMERLRDLVGRARAGRLQRAEMADPTITVTNLGDLGVESVFGVIYPPQVALVGFGRVMEQPWALGGMLGVRPVVIATLSADHRVSDGLRGGRFLARVDELLQKPEEL